MAEQDVERILRDEESSRRSIIRSAFPTPEAFLKAISANNGEEPPRPVGRVTVRLLGDVLPGGELPKDVPPQELLPSVNAYERWEGTANVTFDEALSFPRHKDFDAFQLSDVEVASGPSTIPPRALDAYNVNRLCFDVISDSVKPGDGSELVPELSPSLITSVLLGGSLSDDQWADDYTPFSETLGRAWDYKRTFLTFVAFVTKPNNASDRYTNCVWYARCEVGAEIRLFLSTEFTSRMQGLPIETFLEVRRPGHVTHPLTFCRTIMQGTRRPLIPKLFSVDGDTTAAAAVDSPTQSFSGLGQYMASDVSVPSDDATSPYTAPGFPLRPPVLGQSGGFSLIAHPNAPLGPVSQLAASTSVPNFPNLALLPGSSTLLPTNITSNSDPWVDATIFGGDTAHPVGLPTAIPVSIAARREVWFIDIKRLSPPEITFPDRVSFTIERWTRFTSAEANSALSTFTDQPRSDELC